MLFFFVGLVKKGYRSINIATELYRTFDPENEAIFVSNCEVIPATPNINPVQPIPPKI